nr:DNA helicase [Tanacetum cinerariifolium]
MKAIVLFDLEAMLNLNSKSLKDFGLPMPPQHMLTIFQNRFLMEERNYNPELLLKERDMLIPKLNEDQKLIFDEIINAVDDNVQKLIFVYGHSRTRKTFLWNAITCALCSEEKIVLVVASLALDCCLKDILDEPHTLFGGKSIMLGGDFRQTLPVKKKASKLEIVDAPITTSYLCSKEATPHGNDEGETELLYPNEYMNSLKFAGLPPHRLELKVGVPIILLRNLNLTGGLCNGTRMIVTQLLSRTDFSHYIFCFVFCVLSTRAHPTDHSSLIIRRLSARSSETIREDVVEHVEKFLNLVKPINIQTLVAIGSGLVFSQFRSPVLQVSGSEKNVLVQLPLGIRTTTSSRSGIQFREPYDDGSHYNESPMEILKEK